MIKIAFIKYAGCAAGGTEKFLQNIAANLDKKIFKVDYFYCDARPYIGSDFVHPQNDPDIEVFLKNNGVNLIKFRATKNVSDKYHKWEDTNFWDLFNEDDYDLIQTGRAGHPEYPFNLIKKTKIVDSIHLDAGVDIQRNIIKVMHISEENIKKWINNGGDKNRIQMVSHLINGKVNKRSNLRKELKLDNIFVFGFHQRVSDNIFSEIPIRAFKMLNRSDSFFLLMGGSRKYLELAQELKIDNFRQINFSPDKNMITSFLNTLDVYSHGRKDGEVNSTSIAEAMRHGLPLLTHSTNLNNGQIKQAEGIGFVGHDVESYYLNMKKLIENENLYTALSKKSLSKFDEDYELQNQIKKIEAIYKNSVQEDCISHISYFFVFVRKFLIKTGKSLVR